MISVSDTTNGSHWHRLRPHLFLICLKFGLMQRELFYYCSNPECRNKFNLEEAKSETTLVKLEDYVSSRKTPLTTSLVHILCPKCNTITASFHVPNHE